MNSYFFTDWSAMTMQDWLGLIVTIVVFLLMIGLYVYVFHPANKDKLEAHRHIPLDDDDLMRNTQQPASGIKPAKNIAEER